MNILSHHLTNCLFEIITRCRALERLGNASSLLGNFWLGGGGGVLII